MARTARVAWVRSQLEVVAGKARYNGRPLADWVGDVPARMFERSDASKIVVFGSVQRGDDGPDSDIDLLVVLPHVSRRHDDAVRVLRELRERPVPVDVTVIDEPRSATGRGNPASFGSPRGKGASPNVSRDPATHRRVRASVGAVPESVGRRHRCDDPVGP